MRKLYMHLLRQSKPNHLYFSKAEVLETLSKSKITMTKRYSNYTYKQGGVYIGEWIGGFRHGYGAMVWPDGAKYEGNWSFSRPLGPGKFVHVDGEIYNGRWIKYWIFPRDTFGSAGNYEKLKDLANDGYLWIWIKQELFKIEPPKQRTNSKVFNRKNSKESLNERLKEIKAQVDLTSKKIIEFKKDFKNFSLSDLNKKFNQHKFDNGNVYIGNWNGNKRDGYGKQIWSCGDVYEGIWSNDRQQGIGKHIWGSGNSYFGEFCGDQKEGIGEYRWRDGSYYIGQWEKNKMSGLGKHKWDDGKEYIGEWKNGAREGFGQMIYSNRSKYEGDFSHDRPHGFGILTESEGRILKGMWENGKFIEPVFI